ncbi:hypothetical protein AVEN_129610-1 [Araneus ventricosus]|uniref:Uncharacterized protein n=1 Tax=Araneus ventricosus TaxID=182803 RepID=A0A4Y2J5G8_ARAVE|nr:hypothetical protein AVEN_129610-1 [Araneus ventricosus]
MKTIPGYSLLHLESPSSSNSVSCSLKLPLFEKFSSKISSAPLASLSKSQSSSVSTLARSLSKRCISFWYEVGIVRCTLPMDKTLFAGIGLMQISMAERRVLKKRSQMEVVAVMRYEWTRGTSILDIHRRPQSVYGDDGMPSP